MPDNIKTQVIEEISNQILFLTNPAIHEMICFSVNEPGIFDSARKIEVLSQMEPVEEGFLLVKKIMN